MERKAKNIDNMREETYKERIDSYNDKKEERHRRKDSDIGKILIK